MFFCYEDENASKSRAAGLDSDKMPRGDLPEEPKERLIVKLDNIKQSGALYPEDLSSRVHFIPLVKPLYNYFIMVDDALYSAILTEGRSSESPTLGLLNNDVGVKIKLALLSYMLFIVRDSTDNDALKYLIEYIKNMQGQLKKTAGMVLTKDKGDGYEHEK